MKRFFPFLAAALLVRLAAQPVPKPGTEDASLEISRVMGKLSEISGLRQLHKVRYDTMNKEQFRSYIEKRMREAVKPEDLRAEEITLKKFGFIPRDFNLKSSTVDLLTEQAAAFYDYRARRLYVVGETAGLGQHSALVHELAHALADQHFNLARFIKRGISSDEGSLARMAVMEGQASWLMSEYVARSTGHTLQDSPEMLELMARAAEVASGTYPVLDRTPLYLRETLLFPYTRGMLFQNAVYEREGQAAFAGVFRRPPATTQQVLHPERYFARAAPVKPRVPGLPDVRGFRRLAEGDVGEFDHAVLLRQYVGPDESRSLSVQWKGGAYRLWEHKRDKRTVLAYASEWAGADAAREYFGLYRRVLEGKWKTIQVSEASDRKLAGSAGDGDFVITLDGTRVECLEGLVPRPPAGAAAVN